MKHDLFIVLIVACMGIILALSAFWVANPPRSIVIEPPSDTTVIRTIR